MKIRILTPGPGKWISLLYAAFILLIIVDLWINSVARISSLDLQITRYEILRCANEENSIPVTLNRCNGHWFTEYFSLFDREESKQFLALLLQSLIAALIAVSISALAVFWAEFFASRWGRRLLYGGAVLAFFISAPIRSLGYYALFSLDFVSQPMDSVFGTGVPGEWITSYKLYFWVLVFGLLPPAIFPIHIAFSNYAQDHRNVVEELIAAPIGALISGVLKSSKLALSFAYMLSVAFALSAYHESRQFEQVLSAQKIANAFESSIYGELYAMAFVFTLVPLLLFTAAWAIVVRSYIER